MKLLVLLNILCLVLLAGCEQLSTVFVLETSDSSNYKDVGETSSPAGQASSVSSQRESKSLLSAEETQTNTKIITDNAPPSAHHTANGTGGSHHQNTQHHHQNSNQSHNQNQHHSTTSTESGHGHSSNSQHTNNNGSDQHHQVRHAEQHQQHQQHHNHNHNQQTTNKQQHDKPADHLHEKVVEQQHHDNKQHADQHHDKHVTRSSHSTSNQHAKPKQTIATNSYGASESQSSTSTPNPENRLLIVIPTLDEDLPPALPSKPPKKVTLTSSAISDYDDSPQASLTSGQISKGPQQITITIDNGKHKPDGSVVPSIVISTSNLRNPPTVHTSATHQTQPMKHPIKPQVSANVDGVEVPVHLLHHTTTHRPAPVQASGQLEEADNLASSAGSKPVSSISSLLEQSSRPPLPLSEERPVRPSSSEYDSSRPATHRPPVNRPPSAHELDSSSSSSSSSSSASHVHQHESKYPLNDNCGLMYETKIVGGDVANPSEFLWMTAIIKSKPGLNDGPFCGGSLITRRHILTAAHCLEDLAPRDVLARLGSYDFDDATASSGSNDYAIDQFRVPVNYNKTTHSHDIAIMRLKTPLTSSDNYKTVCMPNARRSYVRAIATVIGYGSQGKATRKSNPQLRQVTVPILENRKCSMLYKRNMTDSFLCAGYEEGGHDSCQGDSGGPLMTEGPEGRMMVVGVVSHGIGCGEPGYPGVYTRITTFLDWIEKNTRE